MTLQRRRDETVHGVSERSRRSLSAARTRAEQRVQRLLDAAFALIDEKGTTEFTIQEVVDRSKQSLRGFYQYFDGKDELLFALLEESIRESLEDLREAVESESEPLERLRAFTIRLHEWCEPLGTRRKRGAHNRLPISEFSLQLAVKDPERLTAVMAPISRMLIELLDAAVAAGAIQVTEHAARRPAHPADRDVRLAHESPRPEPSLARHGRGRLGVLPPRPRRLTPTPRRRTSKEPIHEEPRDRRSSANADRPCAQGVAGEQGRVRARPGGGPSHARAHEDRAERDRRPRHRRESAGRRRHRAPHGRRAGPRAAFRGWRRIDTAQPASGPSRPEPDRSRPAWIASSSREGPRA